MGLCEAYCVMIISVFDCMRSRLVTAQYVCPCRNNFVVCFKERQTKIVALDWIKNLAIRS